MRESALKVDSGGKIPCHTRESNLPQQHACLMLYQLSYIPTPIIKDFFSEKVPKEFVTVGFQGSLLLL